MSSTDIAEKVKKYVEQLKNEDKIGHALSRLDRIEMSLDLLQETKVGKAVNRLQSHEIYGDEALRIVTKWKEIAKKNGIHPKPEPTYDEADYGASSSAPSSSREHRKRQKSDSPTPQPKKTIKQEIRVKEEVEYKPKVKVVKQEPTMFEQMLSTANNVTAKPRKSKPTMDWNKTKPEIDLNYRPLPVLNHVAKAAPAPAPEEEEFNPEKMFRPRNDRIKVFAGRRKTAVLTEVPTLYNCCMRVISNNISSIEDTGDIPFDILRPVLEKCTAQQLCYIEMRNPYLEEDSDVIWERIVTKQFPGKESSDDESWKEAFFRLEREKDDRLKLLSRKIGNSHKAVEDKGQRKAIMADAKAPRDVRIRQMKNGTGHVSKMLPHAIEVSKARKQIFESGSKSSLAAIPSAVINRSSSVGAKKTSEKKVVKKGALMAKTMKMLNIKRR